MERTIIIADEDGAVRRMIARVLDMAGFSAVQVADWPQLRQQLVTVEPSLLLLDLEMLERETHHEGSQAGNGFGQVPKIGMTALPHQHQTARRWGLDFLMEKPLDLTLLLCRVQELLANAAAAKAPVNQDS